MRTIDFGRGFGHTQAMLNGAKNTDGVIIIAHTQQYADELAVQCKNAVGVGLNNQDRIRGRQAPILVDHRAIEVLLEYKTHYENLRHAIKELGISEVLFHLSKIVQENAGTDVIEDEGDN